MNAAPALPERSRRAGPVGLSVCVLALFLIAALSHGAVAQSPQLEGDLVLGLGDRHETHDFYRSVGAVSTDIHGNIYVAERHGTWLAVYDQEGRFLQRLGGRGDGPGEYRAITALGRATEGGVIVADQISHRFTIYSPDRVSMEEARMPFSKMVGPSVIEALPAGGYLLAFSSWSRGEDAFSLLHVVDQAIGRVEESFASPEDFAIADRMSLHRLRGFGLGGNVIALPDGRVVVAEEFHRGTLTVFGLSEDPRTVTTWQGKPVPVAYRLLTVENMPKTEAELRALPSRGMVMAMSGDPDPFFVDRWSITRGLALSKSGTLLHFYYHFRPEGPAFVLQEFSQEGALLGAWDLYRGAAGTSLVEMGNDRLVHVDDEGRLYFATVRDGAPVVTRMILSRRR